jgi:hypothetical protein
MLKILFNSAQSFLLRHLFSYNFLEGFNFSFISLFYFCYKGKYIYYAEGGGDEDVKGGTEIFLALKGGSESSRYTEGEALNFSKFWSSRGLKYSLPP